MKSLRLPRETRLNAGVIVLLSVIIGSLAFAYLVYEGPLDLAMGYYKPSHILESARLLDKVLDEDGGKPVAVMFSSITCPVCRQMEPYWKKLAEHSADLPLDFYILMLNEDTAHTFIEYGVTETPTFIVFSKGQPIARHVGGFTGANVTETMLRWAMAVAGYGLEMGQIAGEFQRYCGGCHPTPPAGDVDTLWSWVNENQEDPLATRIGEALLTGTPLSQAYGGTQNLAVLITRMNNTIPGETAYQLALYLDSLTATEGSQELEEGTGSTPLEKAGAENTLLGLAGPLAALLAGLLASLSPCVFPLLVTYATAVARSAGEAKNEQSKPTAPRLLAVRGFVSSAAGAAAVGGLFLLLGDVVSQASRILLPTAAATIMAAGILGYLGVPSFVNLSMSTRRGVVGFSFVYGLLAVQCSFPLVVGALLLIASGGLTTGALSLLAFTLGIASPVAIALAAAHTRKAGTLFKRLAEGEGKKLSNLFLAFMGFVLLAYSMGLV